MKFKVVFVAIALLVVSAPQQAVAAPIYLFPVADCAVNYARAHHDYAATDILTKAGCKFIAPIDGVIDEVNRTDLWSGKTYRGSNCLLWRRDH